MMKWWRRLAQNRVFDVCAVVVAGIAVGRIAAVMPLRVTQLDFSHYYVSSRLVLEGRNPYTTSLVPLYAQYGFTDSEKIPVATNPPTLLWLFVPFALLPPMAALLAWTVVQVVSLVVILLLTRYLLRPRLSDRAWRFVIAAALASPILAWHFGFSQSQLLLAALVLCAYALHRRGSYTQACLILTAAALLKLFPFVLLPWFVLRNGANVRERATRGAVSLLFATVVVLITGLSAWRSFFGHAVPFLATCVTNSIYNFSIPSFLANLGCAAYGFAPAATVARAWWTVGAVFAIALVGGVYVLCFITRRDIEMEFCLLSVVMLASAMISWGHYLVFLIFPLTVAFVRVSVDPTVRRLLCFGALFILLNNFYNINRWDSAFLSSHIYLKLLANSMPLYGMVALVTFFGVEMRWSPRANS